MQTSSTRLRAAAALAILLPTLLAYSSVMKAGFVWDDNDWALREEVRDPSGLKRIWLQPGSTQQYYPMLFTAFWIEYRLWGVDNPAGYHLVNVLLHALVAILLWRTLERLGFGGAPRRVFSAAWVVGLVFALHPVHVESVAWITERKNTLSTAFCIGALLAYLRFCGIEEDRPPTERRWAWYGAAVALFVAAVLTKTATVVLPAAILVLLWWKRRPLVAQLPPLLPLFGVSAAAALVTIRLETTRVGAAGSDWELSLLERCLLAARIPWFYASKILFPSKLTFIYPRWEIDTAAAWQYLFPVATLGVLAAWWVSRGRIGRGPLAAALLFIGILSPVLGFFDVYAFRFSWVADHFQYLATPSIIALVVGAASHALRRLRVPWRRAALTAATIGVAGLAFLTWAQARIYRDYETLWRDTLDKNPAAWIAHNNLGLAYGERGEVERAAGYFREAARLKPDDPVIRMNLGRSLSLRNRFDEADREFGRAIELDSERALLQFNYADHLMRSGRTRQAVEHYERALELDPDAGRHARLGGLLARLGQPAAAARHYRAALELEPGRSDAHFGLARLLHAQLRTAEAVEQYERALDGDPDLFEAHYNLGIVLTSQGRLDRAAAHFERAVELEPDHPESRFGYATLLARLNREEEAARQLELTIELSPDHARAQHELGRLLLALGRPQDALSSLRRAVALLPDAAVLLTDLAWMLATEADLDLRDGEEAVRLATRARDLTGGRQPAVLDALAAAYAESGRFPEAVAAAGLALDLARASEKTEMIGAVEERLRLYRAGRAYRSPRP